MESTQSISAGWNSKERENQSLLLPNQQDFLLAVLKSQAACGPRRFQSHTSKVHSSMDLSSTRAVQWFNSRGSSYGAAAHMSSCTAALHTVPLHSSTTAASGYQRQGSGWQGSTDHAVCTAATTKYTSKQHSNNNKKALQHLGREESAKKEIVEKENRRAMWTWVIFVSVPPRACYTPMCATAGLITGMATLLSADTPHNTTLCKSLPL